MGYETKVDGANGLVEVRAFESVGHDEHLAAREDLLRICLKRGIRKILVDARELTIRDETAKMELLDFGAFWSELTRGMPVLVAGVLPRDPHTREALTFGDTVASDRGLVARVFEDVEEARTWLLNAEP